MTEIDVGDDGFTKNVRNKIVWIDDVSVVSRMLWSDGINVLLIIF